MCKKINIMEIGKEGEGDNPMNQIRKKSLQL